MTELDRAAQRPELPIDPLDRPDTLVGAALYEEYIALLFPDKEADE